MSTSLLGKLPNDFTCFDNLNVQGLIFWTLLTFTAFASDQLSNMLVKCFTAVYLNSYLKKLNVYRKELCELFFLVFLIHQHSQNLDFYHFMKEENF